MQHHRGQVVEVESRTELDRRLGRGPRSLAGWHLQSVDLTACAALTQVDLAGALFLGCTFDPGQEEEVRARGGIVFPQVPEVPIDSYRSDLYTPEELFDTLDRPGGYGASLDARAYAWSQQPPTPDVMLARALHDHAMDQALSAWVRDRHVVGVMGGHAARRGSREYVDAALLGHALGARMIVATGGGPGAMEAANLGARLARQPRGVVREAVDMLAATPSFRPSVDGWARAAFAVRDRWPEGVETLGVPTWHYGHEPPNPFAGAIAKYFANATREAVLLEVCDAGIVFLPGAAGTVQEIFQDACENYYADPSSIAPMVLVGVRHWTEELPAWPLLRALARDRQMADQVHLVDDVAAAAALIGGSPGSTSSVRDGAARAPTAVNDPLA